MMGGLGFGDSEQWHVRCPKYARNYELGVIHGNGAKRRNATSGHIVIVYRAPLYGAYNCSHAVSKLAMRFRHWPFSSRKTERAAVLATIRTHRCPRSSTGTIVAFDFASSQQRCVDDADARARWSRGLSSAASKFDLSSPNLSCLFQSIKISINALRIELECI
ncbi:hypothetical protein SCHPADRAFT_892665 [Schizopora paradoxa]|uniref:Uncharacterized protein n=1 Tax=Schizopora paradoxa TaxID=27342 RepID=A0A0H2RE16_9AGAM|nr:hypothetical protein SCHPADRAFT_892665 [Schizopora paradoxa]